MKHYGYVVAAGIILQIVACMMNGDDKYLGVQVGIGLVGVLLMIIGFHHIAG